MKIDKLLEPTGLKYEELTLGEKEIAHEWMEALKGNKITVSGIRDYLHSMRGFVEEKLAVAYLEYDDDIFLKARLRNYMLLEAFLSTPEKAQKMINAQIESLAKNR